METTCTRTGVTRLVVPGEGPGRPSREAEILGFRSGDGSPPFHVGWSDTGHEGLCFPGPNAFAIHLERPPED
jgi:hypothetical protein